MSSLLTRARETAGEVDARRASMPANFGAPHRDSRDLPPATGTALVLLTRRQRLVARLRSFLRRFS